ALTPRATAQLAVDAAGLVALGADDVQAAGLDDVGVAHRLRIERARRVRRDGELCDVEPALLQPRDGARLRHALAELDVGAAAGHVRRDRDRAGLTRARDDGGFLLVVLRVQHAVR